ncbi:MAG: hypothetical protein ABI797_07010 [Chloroflexota bacterium]
MRRSVRQNDGLTAGVALVDIAQGIGRLVERETAVDDRLKYAGGDVFLQTLDVLRAEASGNVGRPRDYKVVALRHSQSRKRTLDRNLCSKAD